MKVPLLDPSRGNLKILEELSSITRKILQSGQYILGKEVESFEKDIANYLGVNHAIGVSSGTDALIASLIALGIGPGDKVICPSFTFFATAGAIHRVGAKPIFVDIFPSCFTLNPTKIEGAITPKTKAIIPVHLFGQSAYIEDILFIAKKYNLFVIEDTAQAIGSTYKSSMLGSFGNTGCFSFFPSKNLGGFGDAGLITTNSDELATKLKCVRNHGMTSPYNHTLVGGNFRIDALQAALLRIKLKHLPSMEESRIQHAETYYDLLKDSPYVLPTRYQGKHTFNQFTIRVPNGRRDELQKFLSKEGISSAVYYPIPLHLQPCFSPSKLALPETEKAAKECLSIPIAAELNQKEIEYVALKLKAFK